MPSMKKQEAVPEINSESIREQYTSTILLKGSVFHDFEHFDFLHFVPLGTSEKRGFLTDETCSLHASFGVGGQLLRLQTRVPSCPTRAVILFFNRLVRDLGNFSFLDFEIP
jgi:hypothetical protein